MSILFATLLELVNKGIDSLILLIAAVARHLVESKTGKGASA